MNVQTIHEHSVCLDLLPVGPTGDFRPAYILDAGCAGLGFSRALTEMGHRVLSCDIQDLGEEHKNDYLRMALYFHAGKCRVSDDADSQARHVTDITLFKKGKPIPKLKKGEVYMGTIEGCAKGVGIGRFDLIKLDIEGAEIPILQNAQHPIAPQVSVEFHAHTGRQTKENLDHLLTWLKQWYDIYGAVWEKRHGCSENYWDVLLIAKT